MQFNQIKNIVVSLFILSATVISSTAGAVGPNDDIWEELLNDEEQSNVLESVRRDMEAADKTVPVTKEKYEDYSAFKARAGRKAMSEATDFEKFMMRFYGKCGKLLNAFLRNPPPPTPPTPEGATAAIPEGATAAIPEGATAAIPEGATGKLPAGLKHYGDFVRIENFTPEAFDQQSLMPAHMIYLDNHADILYPDIKDKLDKMMEDFNYKKPKDVRLFRVSRAEKGAFSGDNPKIKAGDYIRDEAYWSTGPDNDIIQYRYSSYHQSAAHLDIGSNPIPIPKPQEEVTVVIQNDASKLKMLNISGYKTPYPEVSSGELLVERRATFRVLAVEKTVPAGARRGRIVVLRPEEPSRPLSDLEALKELKSLEDLEKLKIRNPFNGEPREPCV